VRESGTFLVSWSGEKKTKSFTHCRKNIKRAEMGVGGRGKGRLGLSNSFRGVNFVYVSALSIFVRTEEPEAGVGRRRVHCLTRSPRVWILRP
jgi:hypothetical protein